MLPAPDGSNSIVNTDIETTATLVGTVETLNGTTMSSVTTDAANSPASGSTVADYFTKVDTTSGAPTVVIDTVGTVTGSVGLVSGEASATVGVGDNVQSEFDITSG